MIIINDSSEAILRKTFERVELKDVSGLPVKLDSASVDCSCFFYWLNVGQYSFYNKKTVAEI